MRTRGSSSGWTVRHLVTIFALLLAAGAATAAIEGYAGWTLPLGDLDDVADAGVHGGAALMTPLLPGVLEIGPALVYHDLAGLDPGDDVTLVETLVQCRVSVPAGPAVTVAAGLLSPSITAHGQDRQAADHLALVLGAGTRFLLLHFWAGWHHAGSLDALSVSAGLRF